MRPIDQQTILITGATDGLGRALAAELAAEGATILVHGRDDRRGEATLQEIGGKASWYRADLSSLAETRALAEAVRADHPRLDVLVNNAGIGVDGPRRESADGHELTFQVNYLSGYLLTRLLLPTLTASAPARIVNVSSLGQQAIDFDDVMITRGYSGTRAYCQSKLAQILFTIDLAAELAGTGVTANALHPATYMPTKMVSSPISTLEEGVRATHRLVTDPALDAVSGRFFDGLQEARANAQAYDSDARARLKALSDELTSP
ncbi:SDR family NAD(P)-dependent oxidoreductase [Actinomadura sp. NPDC048021]|uniref:SDR family NAD(P)-dependent oxidoreductase n=1 Tax=Actinomadura sp. NPDC048021 TaxID=3155385 RepID=UPI0033F9982E